MPEKFMRWTILLEPHPFHFSVLIIANITRFIGLSKKCRPSGDWHLNLPSASCSAGCFPIWWRNEGSLWSRTQHYGFGYYGKLHTGHKTEHILERQPLETFQKTSTCCAMLTSILVTKFIYECWPKCLHTRSFTWWNMLNVLEVLLPIYLWTCAVNIRWMQKYCRMLWFQ